MCPDPDDVLLRWLYPVRKGIRTCERIYPTESWITAKKRFGGNINQFLTGGVRAGG